MLLNYPHLLPRPSARKGEEEGAPLPFLRFDPDGPTVTLHDLLAYGQADPCPRVLLLGMEALEHLEDPVEMNGVHADAVIPDPYRPATGPFLGLDEYAGWIVTMELDRLEMMFCNN
jgi:hypothetical protein